MRSSSVTRGTCVRRPNACAAYAPSRIQPIKIRVADTETHYRLRNQVGVRGSRSDGTYREARFTIGASNTLHCLFTANRTYAT